MTVISTTKALALGGLLLFSARPDAADAAGDALIIANARYENFQRVFGAADVIEAQNALRDVGLAVSVAQNANPTEMKRTFRRFVDGLDLEESAPIVIMLSGAFMHSEAGSYLLQSDLGENQLDASVMLNGFSVDSALAILASYPGRAFLLLGEGSIDGANEQYLRPGVGPFTIPQGVTVIRGPAVDVARFANRALTQPGELVLDAAARFELDVDGFRPTDLVVLREDDIARAKTAAEQARDALQAEAEAARVAAEKEAREAAERVAEAAKREADARAAEEEARRREQEAKMAEERRRLDRKAWDLAQQADSAEAYREYLDAYPDGGNSAQARQRLTAIADEPFYAQRRREEALNLSRESRRNIQRHLSILGYDTRGIDGVFGAGTRGAIKNWQEAVGLDASGYLTSDQVNRLGDQSASRSAELEREAQERQAAFEARDRSTWKRIEGVGDEAGLREYLEEFPDGLFASNARSMLDDLERVRAGRAQTRDRSAWQEARQADTIPSYRLYLERNPGGAFASAAQARIGEIERAQEAARSQSRARDEENALGLNKTARRLAEARLKQLGLDVGKVDGAFDQATRRAIRDYQRVRNLPVSGFLDQATVVRLLAGGVINQ